MDDRVCLSLPFPSRVQVKRTALMLVAYRSHPNETKAMRDAFKAYDVDRNGRVSRAEFQNVLKQQGYTDSEVRCCSYSCSCSCSFNPNPDVAVCRRHRVNTGNVQHDNTNPQLFSLTVFFFPEGSNGRCLRQACRGLRD